MTLIRNLVLVLCLVWLPLNYSNAQDLVPGQIYTTSNIVQPTQQGGPTPWVNGVYQDSLTCWGWGDPGYCGPNAIVRPGGNINFSFGMTDLYQQQAIANILPYTGTGLRVNGYNFSFTAKNGNGWDDGRVDNLTAYVNLYGANGSTVVNDIYPLTYKFNWTTFNYDKTFTNPYAASDLSSVRFGFIGNDANYWAGPYGPEIYNVNFSLKYSVDPCVSNTLYATTCPGYMEALAKLQPAPSTATQEILTTTQEPVVISTPIITTVPVTQSITQPVIQIVQQKSSTPSTSKLLSIISSVQTQINNVEKNVVQQAVQDAAKFGEKSMQEAENTAIQQSQQSQQDSQQTQQNLQNTGIAQTFLNSNRNDIFVLPGSINQRYNPINSSINTTNTNSFSQNFSQQNTTNNYVPQIGVSTSLPTSITEVNVAQQNIAYVAIKTDPLPESNTEQKSVVGPTNPLEKFLGITPNLDNVSNQPPQKPINQKAQDSELAGGVSIASIARQPQGFETYMAILQDVPFYLPTQVYPNQKTVDNQRAMRGLSGASDIRHKELVDSQYRR